MSIKKLEAMATKKWLKLPRNATQAILYHPKVLNVSKAKAKLSLLVALNRSTDHLIQELRPLLSSESFTQGVLDIPAACASIFKAASESVTSLPALKKQCKEQLTSMTTQHWDNHLRTLQVQKMFADIVALEEENHSWRKITRNGLTSGQLSFLLKTGSDTLPTPMNLRHMHIQHGSQCPLCSSVRPITAHILNSCFTALNQGRYSWRHDSVLKELSSLYSPTLCRLGRLESGR